MTKRIRNYEVDENSFEKHEVLTDELNENHEEKDESKSIIEEESPAKVETTGPETKYGVIIGDSLFVNIRKEPIEGSYVLDTLRKGDRIRIHKRVGNFYKISTEKYSFAYILSRFVKEVE